MLASRDLRAGREEFCFLGVIAEPPIMVAPQYLVMGYGGIQAQPAPDWGDPNRPGDEAHFRRQLQEVGGEPD